jgi:hypothetical protein
MKLIYLIEIATPRWEHGSPVTPSICHTPAGATKPTPSDLAHRHAQFENESVDNNYSISLAGMLY